MLLFNRNQLLILLLGLIPLPVFFDFRSFNLIYGCLESNSLAIPINLGLIILLGVLLYFNFFRIKKITSLLSPFFIITPFILYYLLIGGAVLSLAQLLMPIVLLYLVYVTKSKLEISSIFFIPMIGFSLVHFLSYFITNRTGIDRFLSVGDFCVYQSLVTYPGVLACFSLIVLYFCKSRYTFLIFGLLCSLAALSQRKLAILDFTGLVLINYFFRKRTRRKFLFAIALILSANLLLDMGLFNRLHESILSNDLSSGRSDIVRSFMSRLDLSDIRFYLGYDVVSKPPMHNFVLNLIYSMGLVGAFLYLTPFFFLIFLFFKRNFYFYGLSYTLSSIFLLSTSSLINSSITQPYFISNFMLLFIVWRGSCLKIKSC